MSYLLNNKYLIFLIVVATAFLSACSQEPSREKFDAPVEEVFQLDSTKIGVTTVASELEVPWEIVWGPDDQIWFTEQKGVIGKVDPHTGKETTLINIEKKVYKRTTPGLLGMDVYTQNGTVYVFVTYTHKVNDTDIVLRLERYTVRNDTLTEPLVLLDIPGNTHHNGSRVAVSPKGKVFWATGDVGNSRNAQDTTSLNGKILRLNIDGSVPKDNPFPGSPVWAFGFRAPEGLVYTKDGILFNSTNGPASDDEVNLIVKGGNYGWPDVMGYPNLPKEQTFSDSMHTLPPLKAWTPTVAPSGIDYYGSSKIPEWSNSILIATLKGSSLRVLKLNKQKDAVVSERVVFNNKYGRLRDVCVSPSGDIYIATSNRDWKKAGKGTPRDDRIIRVARISDLDNLSKVDVNNPMPGTVDSKISGSEPKILYQSYCSSCHRPDGNGVSGTFPALNGNSTVTGTTSALIAIVLKGDAAIKNKYSEDGEKMPAFNFLSDQQIADILSYIRTSWNNDAGRISTVEVESARKKL